MSIVLIQNQHQLLLLRCRSLLVVVLIKTSVLESNPWRWQEALHFFLAMASARIQHNIISYSAAMNAFEKGGRWQQASELFADVEFPFVECWLIEQDQFSVLFATSLRAIERTLYQVDMWIDCSVFEIMWV